MWDEEKETIQRDDLEELQLKKLQDTVHQAYERVPYYHKKFNEIGLYQRILKH